VRRDILLAVLTWVLLGALSITRPADASEQIGTGKAGLLGGDLTDPQDAIQEREPVAYAQDRSENELRPLNAAWLRMKSAPTSPPGTPPHQRHAYQSWQGAPACSIFLNNPEKRKWYVGFKDGGRGGPTRAEPYYCAVEFRNAFILTHFTLTTAPDMPDRDPKSWAIQGSNTGKDDEWTDLYTCNAPDREGSPLRANPRCETTLFTSFTSADMAKAVSVKDLRKFEARLKGRNLEKADFAVPARPYRCFRIAVYSCFNANTMQVEDVTKPPGFALGQVELFGVSAATAALAPARKTETAPAEVPSPAAEVGNATGPDVPFIISYWCGPPKSETTLARYKEIAEAGFNVAMPAIDASWGDVVAGLGDAHNRKFLDLCKQVGIKGIIWAGVPLGGPKKTDWGPPAPAEIPAIHKALDALVAKYSSHPALLGYFITDEPGVEKFDRLAVVNQYLLKKDPKHLPYINLLPNYAGGEWKHPAYEATVARYIDVVKPALVSWDHYRQMFEGGDENFYWHNLEAIRRLCSKANLPYNQIIVSLKHMGYRECSEADLRWQVYTSLAYGSRGIQYFTYWDVKELAWAGAPAIMTLDGRRDVKYEYVKRINHRIAALGPTLVNLTLTGAYCSGPMPPGGQPLVADAPVKNMEGGPMLVGCFQDAKGLPYVMVVNRSFRDRITARLTLDGKTAAVSEISQETGKALDAGPLTGGVLDVPLEAGEGRLFVLVRRSDHSDRVEAGSVADKVMAGTSRDLKHGQGDRR